MLLFGALCSLCRSGFASTVRLCTTGTVLSVCRHDLFFGSINLRARVQLCGCSLHAAVPLLAQELTKSMALFGYDILQALVNDIAPDAKVGTKPCCS